MTSLDNLIKVKRTQLQIMHDRGFDIHQEESMLREDVSIVEFMKFYDLEIMKKYKYDSLLSNVYTNPEDDKTYYIKYIIVRNKSMLPLQNIDDFSREIRAKNCNGGMIISNVLGSHTSNKRLVNLSIEMNHKIQHYLIDELMYNPTQHVLVPPHYVLKIDEKKKFYRANENVKAADMPLMRIRNLHLTNCWKEVSDSLKSDKCGDPIAKYYGMGVGDIVQISRENQIIRPDDSSAADGMVANYTFFRRVEG